VPGIESGSAFCWEVDAPALMSFLDDIDVGYLHRQRQRLVLFLEDGNIPLTNNRRERELRKLVIGRRNWLFTWKDDGGERIANILTIVSTCRPASLTASTPASTWWS
jgi:hypothetical protein